MISIIKPIVGLKFLLCLIFIFSACATAEKTFKSDIKLGMEKYDVIDAVGGPQIKKRRNSKDFWIYVFHHGDKKIYQELQFKNGKVVYKGDPSSPPEGDSAEELDQENAARAEQAEALQFDRSQIEEKRRKFESYMQNVQKQKNSNEPKPSFKEL